MIRGSARTLVVASFLTLGLLLGPGCSCGGTSHPAQQDAAPQQDAQQDAQEDAWVRPDGYLPDSYQQPDGYVPDGGSPVHIRELVPTTISRDQDNDVEILGAGFQDGAAVTLHNCDTGTEYSFTATVTGGGGVATITIPADPTREQGLYSVTIVNPDGSWATLDCVLRISAEAPPTVTNVTPASASNGDPNDGISSDQPVTITGTGFQSTPNVRWQEVATGAFYNAAIVGFISDTQLTAMCPSETKHMPAGDYHVWVVNPSGLSAEWMTDATTLGVFKIFTTPPPRIDTINPQSFPGADCNSTSIAVTGANFVAGSAGTTFWIVIGTSNGCTGGKYDPQGSWICPITGTASDATHASIILSPNCPTNGPHGLEAINPDGQAGTYYYVMLTPSSDCHMQAAGSSWTAVANSLTAGRYLFASATGCDEFGHSFIYAAGGLDGSNAVVDSVELSEVNLLGVPGPWSQSLQYLDAAHPRVINTLGGLSNPAGRAGLTVVRVGRHLFAVGGAAAPSNVNPGTTPVTALATTEHAFILGYETIPMAHLPTAQGTGGLPTGSWYYRVSAIGAFGEGLASEEVMILNDGGTLRVCWTKPSLPATKYNVYRTGAADGRSRSETLLAAGIPGDDSGIPDIRCFTDDGLGALTPAPGRLRGVTLGTGALAASTYRYRVSATIDDGTLPVFETLGGYEVAVQLTATGAVELHWDPVQYASAYNVYKWSTAAQKFVLFASTADGTTLTLTDDGSTPTATCPVARADNPCAPREGLGPLPAGSLSTWSPSPVLLNDAREGLDGVPVVYEDPVDPTSKRYFLVVAGGRSSNALGTGALLTSVESVEVDATTGDLISGTGFWVQETQTMNTARAFFSLVTNQGRQDPTFCPPAAQPPCQDLDGDGYFDCACASPDQMPCDCDDTDPEVHPGQTETGKCTNGKDDDCDGYTDCNDTTDCSTDPNCNVTCTDDLDGDGHISVACGGDDCCDSGNEQSLGCNPTTAGSIHPGATEVCGDGIDQNCDGVDEPCACDTDADGDGHISVACGGDDCCDSGLEGNDFFTGQGTLGCNPTTAGGIFPGSFDPCGDSIDQNCDGWDSLCGRSPGSSRARGPRPRVVDGPMSLDPRALRAARVATRAPRPQPVALPKLYGSDQRVWLVAAQGLPSLALNNNGGTSQIEACELAQTDTPAAGALLVACSTTANKWSIQDEAPSHATFGQEVLLYGQFPGAASTVSCFYNFFGVQSQDVGGAPSAWTAQATRFPFYTNPAGNNRAALLGGNQGGAPSVDRSYYQMVRLNGYVYVIGGHTGSAATPSVQRIQQ
jgi:hypothetical protein